MNLPTVIVLASGRGERFKASGGQGNKLHAMLGHQRVIDWTLAAVRDSGLAFHVEDTGHAGMGDSIAAGVRSTRQAAGWLVMPADLPLIQPQTIKSIALAIAQGAQAAYPVCDGQRGHPVGFAQTSGDSLANLEGNQGAARILSAYSAIEIVVNDVGCVTDIDTLGDLHKASQRLPTIER
jgi:molybdenum cofactor cytidylyltransferase